MLPSASNGNDLANPFFPPNIRNFFDQTHFFNFSKHNQYAKPSAKAFDSFHPLALVVSRSEKNAFEKCHLNKSEVAFCQSCPTTQKSFQLNQCACCSKTVVHFFTFWEKVNTSFSLFLKISPLCDNQIRFPYGMRLTLFVRSFSHYIHTYKVCVCCFRSLFSKLRKCSDKSFIHSLSGCHVHNRACEEFLSKQINSLLSNSKHNSILSNRHSFSKTSSSR